MQVTDFAIMTSENTQIHAGLGTENLCKYW